MRHYEKLGILQAHRTQNGYRGYPDGTVDRVKAIRFLLASGLPTTIAEILPAMIYQHRKLADLKVRLAIEHETVKIKSQIDNLPESYKGEMRWPIGKR